MTFCKQFKVVCHTGLLFAAILVKVPGAIASFPAQEAKLVITSYAAHPVALHCLGHILNKREQGFPEVLVRRNMWPRLPGYIVDSCPVGVSLLLLPFLADL